MEEKKHNDHLWRQFIMLGEMIGDGLHYEDPQIEREYKRLSKILIPDTPEIKKIKRERREERNKHIDENMKALIEKNDCDKCKGKLKQSRSGSYIAYCTVCGMRYKAHRRRGQ